MKYVKEVLLIMAFTFIGEILHAVLPFPVPAGVYGLLLLLLALMSGRVKLADVETSGNFLLDTMTMMFIPAGVAIMDSFSVLQPVIVPYLAVILVSTILVLSLTGLCAQKVLSLTETADSSRAEAEEMVPEFTTGIGREGEKKV